jgi:hypothetical protein
VYAVIVTAAAAFFTSKMPFLLGVYEENYMPCRRGRLFSTAMLTLITVSLTCNFVFGKLLKADIGNYVYTLMFAGVTGITSAIIIFNIPSSNPVGANGRNPFRNFSLIYKRPIFGYILLVWFIFGFANLWIRPLRVVYLAEAERGLDLSPMTVLIIMGIIPEATRLLFTRIWAKLFDRVNFIVLRIALNLFLAAGVLIFFISNNPVIIGVGSFFSGMGFAGGAIAWHLWVTKVAPKGEAHIYGSIHTFLTGLRGIIGPYIGFLFIYSFSIRTIGITSCMLIIFSIILLIPIIKEGKKF